MCLLYKIRTMEDKIMKKCIIEVTEGTIKGGVKNIFAPYTYMVSCWEKLRNSYGRLYNLSMKECDLFQIFRVKSESGNVWYYTPRLYNLYYHIESDYVEEANNTILLNKMASIAEKSEEEEEFIFNEAKIKLAIFKGELLGIGSYKDEWLDIETFDFCSFKDLCEKAKKIKVA